MADKNRDRRRDAAGVGPYARDAERLVRLGDLGKWDVADGEPDIRAWEVRTIGGRQLGTIEELLVDPDAGEAVLMEIKLASGDRHALVPLRIVEIDRHARVVRMDSADLTAALNDAAPEATAASATPPDMTPPLGARDRSWPDSGRVRYPGRDDEVVVESRPVVEEVVVRRRVVEGERLAEGEARPRSADDVT